MEHSRTDDLIEHPAEIPDLFDRQPMELEVLQPVFSLKIARITQAGFADVDCRYPSIRLAQSMDGSLGRPTAGDQNRSISPWLLRGPQQQGECPTPIRVAIEVAVPVEVAEWRRIGVALVKGSNFVRRIGGHWRSPLLPSHVRPLAPPSAQISGISFERFGVAVAKLGQVPLEEIVQEGSDHRDGAELPDLLPARRYRRFDDIGRKLERQAGHQPTSVAHQDSAEAAARRLRRKCRPQSGEKC